MIVCIPCLWYFWSFGQKYFAFLEKLCKIQILRRTHAGVAQLVERNLAKVEVASSRLVSRSKCSVLYKMRE